MTAGEPVTHAQLGELLAARRFGIGASDLHGSLTGFLCGGGVTDARRWTAALELDVERDTDLPQDVREQIGRAHV